MRVLIVCLMSLVMVGFATGNPGQALKQSRLDKAVADAQAKSLKYNKDTPETHWAFEGVSYMETEKLLRGYPDFMGDRGGFHYSSYVFAVTFHAGGTELLSRLAHGRQLMLDLSVEKPGSDKASQEQKELADLLNDTSSPFFKRTFDYMTRAAHAFDREYRNLGVDVDDYHKQPERWRCDLAQIKMVQAGSALVQFSDVSANHWAAKDVLEMRKLGLLHGYEDSRGQFAFN